MVRFSTLSLLLFLLFAAPSYAQVTNVTVDNASPSAATAARTVYRVGLTVGADGEELSTVTAETCADDGAANSRNSRSESVGNRTTCRP